MDELQESLFKRLTLLKRQIKQMYPELSERLKEGPLAGYPEKKRKDHPHAKC